MDFELNAWLDELGISDPEERRTAAALFGATERVNKLKGSVLRQADYSKAMNTLKDQEAAITRMRSEAEAEIEAERGTLTTWRATAEGRLTDAEKRARDAEDQLHRVRQEMRTLQSDYGIEDDRLSFLKPSDGTGNGAGDGKRQPNTDARRSLADDDEFKTFREEVGGSLVGSARLSSVLFDLNNEHVKLFGQPLPQAQALVDEVLEKSAKGQKVNIRDVWESKYKVPEKRAELAQADIDRRVQEGIDAGVRERLEREALGQSGTRDTARSPILGKFGPKEPTTQDNRPRHNGMTGADAARAAVRSGKYSEEAKRIARASLAG